MAAVEECTWPNSKIIAAIGEPTLINRVFTHLGLCAQPPLRAAA
jgi:hypothetical protein